MRNKCQEDNKVNSDTEEYPEGKFYYEHDEDEDENETTEDRCDSEEDLIILHEDKKQPANQDTLGNLKKRKMNNTFNEDGGCPLVSKTIANPYLQKRDKEPQLTVIIILFPNSLPLLVTLGLHLKIPSQT
jgi:hypothetical protein